MILFSFTFAYGTLRIMLKYPSTLGTLFTGGDLLRSLANHRWNEWQSVRASYIEMPKRAFGFEIYLNPNDASAVSSSIATTGWFDLSLTALLTKIVKHGMTAVDVGANIGYYTLLMAKLVGKSGTVLAFEPEPRNFAYLSRSVNVNGFSNVHSYQVALSDAEGPVNLYVSETKPTAHSIWKDQGAGKLETVGTMLDRTCSSYEIDLIKLHAVGAEPGILKGAKRLLEKRPPQVVMAYLAERWRSEETLLDQLFEKFRVFEVVRSPLLIRKLNKTALLKRGSTELYLVPA